MPIFTKKKPAVEIKGKPDFAMAVSVKAKPKKKMAEGGLAKQSAKLEPRPMPSEKANDSKEVAMSAKPKSKATIAGKAYITSKSRPAMMKSDVFSTKLRDQEDDLEAMSPMKHEGMSEDKGPSKEEYDSQHFYEGGAVSQKAAEEDEVVHPEGLESDDDQIKPSDDEIMAAHFAKGGMAEDEAEIEHAASIAAAIMAKRKMMAEGGQVDIESNAKEDANKYYAENEAALKENYDSDMSDVSQPEDSNEHGDSEEASAENDHDESLVAAIRRKMRKSPISR